MKQGSVSPQTQNERRPERRVKRKRKEEGAFTKRTLTGRRSDRLAKK